MWRVDFLTFYNYAQNMKNSAERLRTAVILKYRLAYHDVLKMIPEKTEIKFNSAGFRHLLKHDGHRRNLKDMRHRMSLIPWIPAILKECNTPAEIRGQKELHHNKIKRVQYFTYRVQLNERNVCMVTRKINDGDVYFYSLHEIDYSSEVLGKY